MTSQRLTVYGNFLTPCIQCASILDMNSYSENDTGADNDEEPLDESFEISVHGPGVDITRAVADGVAGSIIALLFGVAGTPVSSGPQGSGLAIPGISPSKTTLSNGQPEWDEDLTLGEFIDETGAKTFQHKISATGYYLLRHGAESFTREDVKTALAQAHEDMPANFNRDFTETAGKSLIARKPGETDRYIIPRTGRAAVESKFQEVPKRRPTRRTSKKASGKHE